jgi:hypothetical protein
MSWRLGEVWLDTDLLWFREEPRVPLGGGAVSARAAALELPAFPPVATGLEASRRRRLEAQAARRRRFTTRTVPAVALVVGSASMLSVSALRQGGGARALGPLQVDPPSLPFRLDVARAATRKAKAASGRALAAAPVRIEWQQATSIGLPYAGRLVDGTQLPVEGPDWKTWSPVTDSVPNDPWRLHGHQRTIRAIVSVAAAHRAAFPHAPPLLIGDISRRDGGTMDQHVSHQNGLDVDVYYPRRDRRPSAPIASSQIDRELAQDLLDRFLAAGAQVVFVGYSTGLRGPGGLVVPYPNHENHMHVRFPSPG